MSTQHGELAPWPANPLAALVAPRTWLASLHLLLNLWLGIAVFTVMTTGLALSFGLLPLALFGVLVFAATVAAARGYAALERRRFAFLLGVDIPPPAPLDRGAGVFANAMAVLRNGVTWRQIGYCLLQLPIGIATFTLTVVAWSVPVGLLILPFVPHPASWLVWFAPPLGLVLLFVSPYVVRGLAVADAALATAMLGPFTRAELAGRVHTLEDSRAKVVDAAETERRRIERDLHDGAQQRLVSLAMTLGRAQARYDTDPDGARALVEQGHAEAKQALIELRELTRGIHPPVLTDRGLDAALSGLAGRSPVPVTVDVGEEVSRDPRPAQTIEAIAYFVVAEALTNIAKHAKAKCASVAVRRHEDTLHLVVLDDGIGGADASLGTGLAGLRDRVSGVDGSMSLDSPPGGPTVLTVELPCAL